MKFNLEKLKIQFKKFTDRDVEKIDFHPKRDWAIILFFFSVLFIILMLFFRYLFVFDHSGSLVGGQKLGEQKELSLENISKQRMNTLLRKWEEKRKKFESELLERPTFDFLQ